MQLIVLLWLLYSNTEARRTDDDIPSRIDVFEEDRETVPRGGTGQGLIPVPFGHIFRDGIGDPNSDLKQPLDLLELALKTPNTREEQKKLLEEVPQDRILRVNNKRLLNQEQIVTENKDTKRDRIATPKTNDNPDWFNFEDILKERMSDKRPVAHRPQPAHMNRAHHTPPTPRTTNYKNSTFFSEHNFEILRDPDDYKTNWTTCAEFAKGGGSFHPKDIVDIDWVPFYIWSLKHIYRAFVHRFTYPTKKIVKEYKKLYDPHLNISLDWEQPKLLLTEHIEMLLVADPNDRTGFFYGVPKRSLPSNPEKIKFMQLPTPKVRIKIEDPYLAMMFCDEFYAVIMASPGNEPDNDQERIEEAGILKFNGHGGPVVRNLALEEAEKQAQLRRQLDYEEIKYIKATNVAGMGVDFE